MGGWQQVAMPPGIEYILPFVWIYFSLSLSKPNSSNVVKYDSLQIYNLTHLAKLLRCHQSSSSKTRTHTRRKTRSIPLGLSLNLHMVVPSCLCLSQQPGQSKCLTKQLAFRNCKRHMKRGCIRRPQILPCANEEALGSRVFVLSDLHTDYSENMTWVKGLSTVRHKKDVLLVAGDVAETHKNFVLTMSLLKDRFEQVFYVPGNHDLWCRCEEDDYLDSLEKLKKLLDACRGLGVLSNPMIIDGLGIIPLFSWYHESFDREKDITGIRIRSLEMACKDFHACKWPGELSNHDTSLALYFDAMNDKNEDMIKEIQKKCSKIISFSHFLPRQELCPEKRMLFYPNLPKIIGSDWLEARIRSIHRIEGSASACHVFGHTHFCWDAVLDGIRYVQAPLAYPRERKRRMNGGEDWLPFCIYSDGKFADRLSPCYWSDYYSANPRAPHITQLAPWVARFYGRPSSHAPH